MKSLLRAVLRACVPGLALVAAGCAGGPAETTAASGSFEPSVMAAQAAAGRGAPAAPVTAPSALPVSGPMTGAPVMASGETRSVPVAASVPDTGRSDEIGLFDVISVEVFGIPALSRTAQVGSDGRVPLALIGDVTAARRTTTELARDIEQAYRGRYVREPSVAVRITERQSRSITVWGSVIRSGVYPINSPVPLSRAIALAGGLAADADAYAVRVFGSGDGGSTLTTYDLRQIQDGRMADPLLGPNDSVVVMTADARVTIDGDVRNPLVASWRPGLTLSQAVAQAGGLSPTADGRNVVILREINGQLMAARFDMGAINGGALTDPPLMAGDRVIVSADATRRIIRDYSALASFLGVFALFRN